MNDTVEILQAYSREHYGLPFVFSNIAIETSNFCNRDCSFCPVGHERKPAWRMERPMFTKIVAELAAIRYRGDIALHWYNEPLADKRLPEFVAMLRAACPNSHIYAASNGDLLTPALFDRLVAAGLSLLRVSQYDGEVSANVRAVMNGPHGARLCVGVKGPAQLGNNRGGSLGTLPAPLAMRCNRPDEQLTIDAHGRAVLCCNDYHGSYAIGSVDDSTLMELWMSEPMQAARGYLRCGDRSQIAVCRNCNEPDQRYADLIPRGA